MGLGTYVFKFTFEFIMLQYTLALPMDVKSIF